MHLRRKGRWPSRRRASSERFGEEVGDLGHAEIADVAALLDEDPLESEILLLVKLAQGHDQVNHVDRLESQISHEHRWLPDLS
jgi:hypothetical protein